MNDPFAAKGNPLISLDFQAIANRSQVTIETYPEDMPVSECFACGDTSLATIAFEKQENAKIQARIDSGDEWAWCMVTVTARSASGITANASLGGCSYADEADFRADGFEELAREAREALATELERVFDLEFREVSA